MNEENVEYINWGNDATMNSIEVYNDSPSQFINTCAMFRKLKLDDLDDGKYSLTPESTPLANFGYVAEFKIKDPLNNGDNKGKEE